MKKLFLLTLLSVLITNLSSCSRKKNKKEKEVVEIKDTQEININESDIVDLEEDDSMEISLLDETKEKVEISDKMEKDFVEMDEMDEVDKYSVKVGDTYMWISYKLYGDYRRWKELKNMNRGKILREGVLLKHKGKEIQETPKGLPHIIQEGETLSIISRSKYGTYKKWKDIWNNNRKMIINPSILFLKVLLFIIFLKKK